MDINQVITGELGVKRWQVDAAVKLIDEGNTIPFIARYRKEVTGTLDDAQLRTLHERLMYLRNLEEKKEQVLASIEEQGKLTEELKKQILAAETMVVVEDLYRPYRPKRRTRAMIAKEKGLEPLAALITLQKAEKPIEVYAEEYVNPEKEVKSGRNYLIFAEGTRTKNPNHVNEFKGGSFKCAMKAQCPIVPVALIDSYKPFDVNSIEKIKVQVHFLEPIRYEEYKDMKSVEIAKEVKIRIEKIIEKNEKK